MFTEDHANTRDCPESNANDPVELLAVRVTAGGGGVVVVVVTVNVSALLVPFEFLTET